MTKLIILLAGIMKILFSAVIFMGCFLAIREANFNSKGAIFGMAVIALLASTYLYYAIRTAILNFFFKPYRINILILLGLLIHFFLCICLY
jgi:hypothetical protein